MRSAPFGGFRALLQLCYTMVSSLEFLPGLASPRLTVSSSSLSM